MPPMPRMQAAQPKRRSRFAWVKSSWPFNGSRGEQFDETVKWHEEFESLRCEDSSDSISFPGLAFEMFLPFCNS